MRTTEPTSIAHRDAMIDETERFANGLFDLYRSTGFLNPNNDSPFSHDKVPAAVRDLRSKLMVAMGDAIQAAGDLDELVKFFGPVND